MNKEMNFDTAGLKEHHKTDTYKHGRAGLLNKCHNTNSAKIY